MGEKYLLFSGNSALGAPQPGRFINGKKCNLFSHPKFLYFLIVVWNKIIIYISFEKINTASAIVFIDKVLDFKRKRSS